MRERVLRLAVLTLVVLVGCTIEQVVLYQSVTERCEQCGVGSQVITSDSITIGSPSSQPATQPASPSPSASITTPQPYRPRFDR